MDATASSSAPSRYGRSRVAKALLSLASTGLVLLVLEVGTRLSGYTSLARNTATSGREKVEHPLPGVRYLYDAHSSFVQRWPSDPRRYFATADRSLIYRVNNYGFRGDDFEIRRGDRLRIAVLGDSYCWGVGVKEEEVLTFRIEEGLNRAQVLGQRHEVYSFCLSGFNTASQVALYEHVVGHFRPDLLLVVFFLNDVNLPPDLYFWWEPWAPPSLKAWRKRLRFLDWVVARIGEIQARPGFEASVNAAYQSDHAGFRSVVDGLRRLEGINAQEGVPTVLAIFPWLVDLERDAYPFLEAHRAVRRAAEERGFAVVDLLDSLEGQRGADLWVHPTDQHPNEVAHEIAAGPILQLIIEALTESAEEVLAGAARRREAPLPPELSAPPEKQWYGVFSRRIGSGGVGGPTP